MVPAIAGVTTEFFIQLPRQSPQGQNTDLASHDEFLRDKCVLNSFCDQFWWEFVIFKNL
jgi:hypothetical protein